MTRLSCILMLWLSSLAALNAEQPKLIDAKATPQAQALYRNLHKIADTATLFGHQSTLAYGVEWLGEEGRSDVKDVTGSYPAVYGWDVGGFEDEELLESRYGYSRDDMIRWAKEAYERGGVVTYAWHKSNPLTGGSFYDKTPAMHAIVPGGEKHEDYKRTLDALADFFIDHGEVPVIFRPWHEHNGDWFWWGKGFVSEEDYIAVWRFTVDYLKNEKGVHNLIYAFSPDRSRMDMDKGKQAYMYGYPGDDYVDIIGFDNYWDVGHLGNQKSAEQRHADFVRSLELVVGIAEDKNKVAALTETGLDTLKDPNWYTEVLLAGIEANETTRKIAYVQVWRNANKKLEGHDHFYVPYRNHHSAEDFIEFRNKESILFEDDLPDLYDKAQ